MFAPTFMMRTKVEMARDSADRTQDPKALICACWHLSTRAIELAIDRGERSMSEIALGCGASGGCGSCRTDVEKILLRKLGRSGARGESQSAANPQVAESQPQLSLFDSD